MQTHDLKLCCGAFRTFPKAALQVDMGEMPLEERQVKMVYWVSLEGHNKEHPTKAVLTKLLRTRKRKYKKYKRGSGRNYEIYRLKQDKI